MAEQHGPFWRRRLFIACVVAAFVVAAYGLVWRAFAREMTSAVEDWVADQRAAGLEVSHGAIRAGGFPFLLRARVDAPMIAAPGQWRWRAEALSITLSPLDLDRLVLSPGGEQFAWAEGYGEWRVEAGAVRAVIANDEARGWTFASSVTSGTAERMSDNARVALVSLECALAPDASDPATLVLEFAIGDMNVEGGGRSYGSADIEARLSVSQTPALALPEPARQWRAAGGVLAISRLKGELNGAQFAVSGRLGLDGAAYPAGGLNAEIANPAGIAALLGAAGALTAEEAQSAAAGLSLMAIAGGGKIVAPVELKDGAASIGGIKIADLPRVK